MFPKLWDIPGVRRHETGDREMRAVFPPEAFPEVADVAEVNILAERRGFARDLAVRDRCCLGRAAYYVVEARGKHGLLAEYTATSRNNALLVIEIFKTGDFDLSGLVMDLPPVLVKLGRSRNLRAPGKTRWRPHQQRRFARGTASDGQT